MDAALMAIDPAIRWAAARLADGSIQGALLIVLVWLLCRTVTAIPPRVRAMLWWVASLKLVLALVPLQGLPLRVLPPRAVSQEETGALTAVPRSPVLPAAPVAAPVSDTSALDAFDELPLPRVEPAAASRPADIPWLQLFLGIWFVVVAGHGALLVVSHRRVSSLVRRASRLPAQEEDEGQQLARRIGLRRPPLVLVSDGITSPQAVGLWRRCILLPVAFAERVTPAEWQMALCHELMHLRRRDLLFGWVPAIAERLFFFHPLARFASEQYLLEREAACDAAVLHALDVDAHDYGRMLLRLGVSRAMPGVAVSGSSPTVSLLRRRLEMLQHVTATAGTSRAHWLVAAAAIALVPFHLAARTPESIPAGGPIAVVSAAPIVAATDSEPVVSPNPSTTRQVLEQFRRAQAATAKAQAGTSAEPLTFDPFQLTADLQKQSAALDQMRRLLERREALAQVYNPSHPDMLNIEQELKRLEALVPQSKLAELRALQAGNNSTTSDDARERALRAELDALKARLQDTPAQLSATIEREKANIARQEKLLEEAKRRLAAAEEKLRATPQPVTPQEPKQK